MSPATKASSNPDYHAARAMEERRLAMASADARVRQIHLEMAERYSELAKSGTAEPLEVIADQQRAG